MSKTNIAVSVFLGLCLVMLGVLISTRNVKEVQGSVAVSGEYRATTTQTGSYANGTATAGIFEIATSSSNVYGTLGSVIVTASSSSAFTLYDATTTNSALRGSTATSSIVLASFPAGTLPGTFTFDVIYTRGLIVVFNGTIGSTTITYR